MPEVTFLEALRQRAVGTVSVVLMLAAGSVAAAVARAQSALPRVFVSDSSVAPGDPRLVWLPGAVSEAPLLRGGMRLVYPDSLRRKGIIGTVLLEFVVDTLGRVEPGVRVLRTAHPVLVGPAKEMIRGAHYTPGRVRGRAVRTLVRLGLRVAPPPAGSR